MKREKAEYLANISIILATVVFLCVVAQKYYESNKIKSGPVGETIIVSDIDWQKYDRTVLLALQEGCRYCTESASFYKKLAQESLNSSNTFIVAVFPSTIDSGQKYLNELGLNSLEIRQSSLQSVKVAGSPSVLIINKFGKVVNAWVGKLDQQREQ